MKSWYARVGLGITLCLPAIVGGCSEERPEINRVQPNGYPKSFFLGEKIADPSDDPVFFMRGYTVGHTHAQSEMTVGTGTGTDKIRWEITEDKLIARKAYQTVTGRDDKGLVGPDSIANGTVVASFNILSHYDIRRQYNDGTGEDLNVVDENTTDRPWNERDYMRVDWSSNEVVSSFWDNFFFAQLFGGSALVTPVSYAVTDPTSPDAPHYEPEDGYLDITARYQVYPASTETPWGNIPTCLFAGIYTGTNNDDCNAQEAVMRWSFWKRPSTDYEPFANPTAAEDIIANFGSAGNGITPGYGYRNQSYDPQYGYIDDKSNWWVGRHNIWKASHIKDGAGNFVACTSNADLDNNGTADACQDIGYTGNAGSQCDTIKGLCTIPYRDREIRQLTYYLNEVFGDLYQDHTDRDGNFVPGAAEDIAKSWDQMFRNTVGYAREVECRRTGGGSREECHGQYFESTDDPSTKDMVSYGGWLTDRPRQDLAGIPTEIELQQDPSTGGPLQVQKQRVVVVCHNPVRDTDSKTACKPAGYVARYGDMRHNFMSNWPNDSRAPYGGVAHFSIDPESGEYFGNTALTIYIPGRARRQFDALLLQMGEINLDEYIEGLPGAIVTRTLSGKFNGFAKRDKGLSNKELDSRTMNAARNAVGKLDIEEIKARGEFARKNGLASAADIQKRQQALLSRIKASAGLKVDTGIGSLHFANHQAAVTPLLGTQIESDLIDADLLNGTGNNPAGEVTDDALLMASPLRGLDPAKRRALADSVQQKAALHGFCFGPESEATLTGSVVNASLAQYFANKYGGIEDRDERWSRMFEELEIESFKGVMLHEFGHSLGHRHQFASSFDSMNFMPQYWQLRTKEGQASQACVGGKNRLETFQGNGDGSAGKDVPANQQGDRLDNDTCMGPRYIDPPTADEMGLGDEPRPAIDYFAGTSTMEYQSERFSETAGLGTFDQHMIQAVYGRVLESYDPNAYSRDEQGSRTLRMWSQLIDANYAQGGRASEHYTEMARGLNLHDDARCREATEEEKAKAAWRVVHGKVCAPPPRDHAAWDDFVSDPDPLLASAGLSEPLVRWHTRDNHPDLPDAVRWSYRYGESYSPAYIHTNLTDSGADIYEVTTNQIKQYESQYINSYFRRRNRSFTGNGTAFRTADSVYEVLRSYHWQVANNALRLLAQDTKGDAYLAAIADDNDARPDVMANRAIFDVLSQAVLMPQPGALVQLGNQSASQGDVYDAAPIDPYAPAGTPSSDKFLGIDQGRFVDPEYDYTLGGSYNYTNYTKRAGFSGEKAFAFLALSDSRPTLSTISRENYLDGRTPALNFRNDFPDAFDRLMGGLLAEDWQAVAPSFGDCDGTGEKVQPLDLTAEVPARCQAPGVTVFPNVGYRQQFRSALFAQLYARENTDMTLVNKTRIWIDGLEGNISDAGFPKPEDRVEFYDPLSGYTYIARRFGTETVAGRAVERGIASRMLIRANELVLASYEVKQDQGAPMISPTGKISLELDAAGQPKELADGRKADLQRYRGLIDSVRQMGHILGEGPLLTERHLEVVSPSRFVCFEPRRRGRHPLPPLLRFVVPQGVPSMSMRNNRAAIGVTLGLLAGLASGCADEKPPIVRVQPQVLDKAFFLGANLADPKDDPEFFQRGYVIDGSASQSEIGVGTWAHVDRIRWEITENMLIARKAYQIVEGSDGRGLPAKFGNPADGVVVAAYKITKHFDVRRGYNPSTGEQNNVIEENTDRPWYQRESFRVDWSSNEVNDPMWGESFMAKTFGNFQFTPLKYSPTDPNSPDQPYFGEADKGYFDVTNRFYIKPVEEDFFGFPFPKCALISFLTDSASYECDAQEATVRFSFMKVDDDEQDFESLENTKASLDVVGNPGGLGDSYSVGIVTAGRQTYDPKYQYLDGNYHAFSNIHNIWKKSHVDVDCDSKADDNHDGTADQCEGVADAFGMQAGSQCDVFANRPNATGPYQRGRCTIPYRNREIRTIAYFTNKEMPAELVDPVDSNGQPTGLGHSEDIIKSWDQMLANAVAYAREVECRRTGGERDTCHSEFFSSASGGVDGKTAVSFGGWLTDQPIETKSVITLCHNPVRDYDDHEVCGATGDQARLGDIRKNFMAYWPYDSRAPYGGIANWEGDPLTGRIIGAAALTMGRSVTYGSAFARDVLQVAMGDTSINDLVEGVPAATYSQKLISGQPGYLFPKSLLEKPVTDPANAASSMALRPLAGGSVAQQYSSFLAGYGRSMQFTADPEAIAAFDARVKPLVGSKLEASIVSPQWLSATLHTAPNTEVTPDLIALSSPVQKMSALRMRASTEALRRRFTEMGACFTELDGSKTAIGSVTLPSLAAFYKNKFSDDQFENPDGLEGEAFDAALHKWRGDAIYRDLVGNTYKGIELHEVGHSLGMLHQFASSWDAPNYNPQYWQLRTHEQGTSNSPSCNGAPTTNGESCMGPRYLDPETADERGRADEPRPGLPYFSHTSTMEYQYDRFGESVGLGSYDQFTMKALYGRVIETHDENITGIDDARRFAHRMRSQQNEQDVIDWTTPSGSFPQPVHYTELARQMNIFDPNRDCRDATGEEIAKNEWRIVHGKVCQHTPKDHVAWGDLQGDAINGADPNTAAPYWHSNGDSPMGEKVRWFYRWGSEFNSHIHVNPFDSGADVYEVSVAAKDRFEASYPFAYFRRKQREFNFLTIANGVLGSYFERLRSYHWDAAVRGASLYSMLGPKSQDPATRAKEQAAFDQAFQSDDWHRPYDKASAVLFNAMAAAVVTPQVGTYSTSPDENRTIPGWQNATILDTKGDGVSGNLGLDIGTGARYLDDDYDSGPFGGGSWQYTAWAKRVGFEQEKGLAFYALTEGSAPVFAPNREFFLDWRTQHVSFQADMPGAVDRLLGGILSEDWETVAPFVTNQTAETRPDQDITGKASLEIQTTNLIQEGVARPDGAKLLFPNIGYRQQSIAAILAGIYSRDVDMTLVNKMRIYVEGVDGDLSKLTVPDEQQVRFYNPNTGFTYLARKFGPQEIDGKTVDRGIGSRMLQYANILQAAAYEVVTEDGSINGKPVFNQYGQPELVLRDADGNITTDGSGQPGYKPKQKADGSPILPRPTNTQQATVVRHDRYVGMLDATRQIGLIFGAGPL